MSQHTVTVQWERRTLTPGRHGYSRAHTLVFDGGAVVPGSSSPSVVRLPYSDPAGVDPEEMFVASLSSCHMLWFLDLAARDGLVVESYLDTAEGEMKTREDGRLWVARVTLQPEVVLAASTPAAAGQLERLHHRAHEECFLANSVKTEVVIRLPA
ncbi:MAG: OsmC family protein [Pseudomonadota bacterium]